MQTKIGAIGYVAIFFIVACFTVNNYCPAAEVQKAAEKIVDNNSANDKEAPAQKAGPTSRLDLMFGVKTAYADVSIDVSTPAVLGIKESIRKRFKNLKIYFDKGTIGESNNGFVEAIDTAALSVLERSVANNLIDEENKDRAALYSEIANANKPGPETVSLIKKIFANRWREKAQSGWWVQDNNGSWSKKK
jgi:uncharacterized protein YdbL (DUF1318 family)